jgi:hypothetical protein
VRRLTAITVSLSALGLALTGQPSWGQPDLLPGMTSEEELQLQLRGVSQRVHDLSVAGMLSEQEARDAFATLDNIRRREFDLGYKQDGRLSAADFATLRKQLDQLARRLDRSAPHR